MNAHSLRLLLAAALGLLGAAAAGEMEPAGRKIMDETDQRNVLHDEIVEGETVVRKKFVVMGRKVDVDDKRRTTSWSMRYGKNNVATIIRYHTPKEYKNLSVLSYRDVSLGNKPYIVWQWEPEARPGVLKLVSGPTSLHDNTASFALTDFTFEDLEPEDLDAFVYVHVRDETIDKTPCFVVEAYKKPECGRTGYCKREVWVSKDKYLIHKVNFYHRATGKLDKVFAASDFVEVMPGIWRANTSTMTKVLSAAETREGYVSYTKMTTTKRRPLPGIPPWFFNTNALKVTDDKGLALIEEMWAIHGENEKLKKEIAELTAQRDALKAGKPPEGKPAEGKPAEGKPEAKPEGKPEARPEGKTDGKGAGK